MEIAEHVEALRREGSLLADAAAAVDLGAPVSHCPDWTVRELVRHIGGVHRWAATYVREARPRPMDDDEERRVMAPPDDDGALLGWFREGHANLVKALESAPADLDCWSFLPAPSPLAFWARRQAHETAIHRADAQGALVMYRCRAGITSADSTPQRRAPRIRDQRSAGGAVAPFPPALAADGVDELLLGFASRPGGRLRADPPRTLGLHASDAGRHWLVRVQRDRIDVSDRPGDADWSVAGPASDLYLLLWNRRGTDGLRVSGDPSLLELWRTSVRVRWS